ncbi:MAG: PDZ domain-containing protein [Actinomycetota bacterium]
MRRQTAYGVLLAVVAIAILVIGYLLRPSKLPNEKGVSTAPDITAIQAEVERLRHLTEQNQRRATSSRFAAVADDASAHLLYAPGLQRSGIIWRKDGSILLPSGNLPPPASLVLQTQGRQISASPLTWGAAAAFMMARADTMPGPPATLANPGNLSPGAWVVAVALDQHGQIHLSPGNFGGISSIDCGGSALQRVTTNLPLGAAWIGAGVFDLDGNLIAAVTQCNGDIVAISASAVAGVLKDAEDPIAVPSMHAGIKVSEISPRWAAVSQSLTGLIVTEVWEGWPAERAGIQPGDVIMAANGRPVRDLAGLNKVLDSAGSTRLRLRRRRRFMTINLQTGAALLSGPPAVTIHDENGVQLSSVQPDSNASKLGLVSGDRIISLDGLSASGAAVARLFAASARVRPVVLVAQRGSRRFLAVMAP